MRTLRAKLLLPLLLLLPVQLCEAQVYTEKQTRHRFAQLHLGLDVEASVGGTTRYLDGAGRVQSFDLPSAYAPRFVIGGTHFWGHADFHIAIPLYAPQTEERGQEIQFLRGVETVFKYYPWRIQHAKFRPYVGVSVAPFYFEQSNSNLAFGNGPELYQTAFPLLGGVTFNARNHLVELGLAWNYANENDYAIDRATRQSVSLPPVYVNLAYRYILDTTISAEAAWESGQTQAVTDRLASQGKLDGVFLGVGMSSAFWLGQSSYNTAARPYLEPYGISLMPDLGIGYYLHRPDLNIGLAYRSYGTSTNVYGASQALERRSMVFEVTKYLFDYHGFVPFVGPAISYERLSFEEAFEQQRTADVEEQQVGFGLTFGWDIRPNRLQSWILRTNLRWYPTLSLPVAEGQDIAFGNVEFNFIQLILYPNRIF
ncbi:MAG: hypothetical protein AAFR95_11100 [Bacteroidota bacterium]